MRLNERGVRPKTIQRANVAEIDDILVPVCRGGHLRCRTRNNISGPLHASQFDNGLTGGAQAMVVVASGSSASAPQPQGTWYCYGSGFLTRDDDLVNARTSSKRSQIALSHTPINLQQRTPMYFVLDTGMMTTVSADAFESYLKVEGRLTSIFTTPLFNVARDYAKEMGSMWGDDED
ncbi:hypothetical protein DFH06DRAFT_1153162 [Mycena polygramma]|nr:hypothetical protein DFH06DRAFT_1153162 [Mycena polygramma]